VKDVRWRCSSAPDQVVFVPGAGSEGCRCSSPFFGDANGLDCVFPICCTILFCYFGIHVVIAYFLKYPFVKCIAAPLL
jgi:hypothetical protein